MSPLVCHRSHVLHHCPTMCAWSVPGQPPILLVAQQATRPKLSRLLTFKVKLWMWGWKWKEARKGKKFILMASLIYFSLPFLWRRPQYLSPFLLVFPAESSWNTELLALYMRTNLAGSPKAPMPWPNIQHPPQSLFHLTIPSLTLRPDSEPLLTLFPLSVVYFPSYKNPIFQCPKHRKPDTNPHLKVLIWDIY